jgi:hypothetical protein
MLISFCYNLQTLSMEPVVYNTFENAPFAQQVDFFSSVDIVVSPHGVQLTGVHAIPATVCKCFRISSEMLSRPAPFQISHGKCQLHSCLHLYLSDDDVEERNEERFKALVPKESSIRTVMSTRIICSVKCWDNDWEVQIMVWQCRMMMLVFDYNTSLTP